MFHRGHANFKWSCLSIDLQGRVWILQKSCPLSDFHLSSKCREEKAIGCYSNQYMETLFRSIHFMHLKPASDEVIEKFLVVKRRQVIEHHHNIFNIFFFFIFIYYSQTLEVSIVYSPWQCSTTLCCQIISRAVHLEKDVNHHQL